MNIEQAVIENLRELPSQNQQEVLTFIKALQEKLEPQSSVQQALRSRLTDQLLPELQHIQRFHDGFPSAVYADSLLRTMQDMFTQFPDHPLTEVLTVLHDAMAFQNRWSSYTPEQYQEVYVLLESLSLCQSLSQSDVSQAIQQLSQVGLNTMPYEVMESDTDPEVHA